MESKEVRCPINPGCKTENPNKCDVSRCPFLMNIREAESPPYTRKYASGRIELRSPQKES